MAKKKGKLFGKSSKQKAPKAKNSKPKEEKKAKPAKKKEPKAPKARTAPSTGSCRFVCSECYSEFLLPSTFSKDALTCPECLHVGKRPDQDFLRTVLIHKSQERQSLLMAFATGGVFLAASALLIWQVSPYANGAQLVPPMILTLVAVGLLAVFLFLAYRFESNRWEVYF